MACVEPLAVVALPLKLHGGVDAAAVHICCVAGCCCLDVKPSVSVKLPMTTHTNFEDGKGRLEEGVHALACERGRSVP